MVTYEIKLSITMLLELGTDKEAQQLQKDGGNQSGITKGGICNNLKSDASACNSTAVLHLILMAK